MVITEPAALVVGAVGPDPVTTATAFAPPGDCSRVIVGTSTTTTLPTWGAYDKPVGTTRGGGR